MTEDEKVGWYHWLSGHGFGWIPGVGGGQGGLACCGSWGHKESDMTEWLNWTMYLSYFCVNKFQKWLKSIHLFIFHFNKVLTYQTTHSLNIDLSWIYVTSLMLSDRDWLQVTIKFWSQKLTFSLESMVTLIKKQS